MRSRLVGTFTDGSQHPAVELPRRRGSWPAERELAVHRPESMAYPVQRTRRHQGPRHRDLVRRPHRGHEVAAYDEPALEGALEPSAREGQQQVREDGDVERAHPVAQLVVLRGGGTMTVDGEEVRRETELPLVAEAMAAAEKGRENPNLTPLLGPQQYVPVDAALPAGVNFGPAVCRSFWSMLTSPDIHTASHALGLTLNAVSKRSMATGRAIQTRRMAGTGCDLRM